MAEPAPPPLGNSFKMDGPVKVRMRELPRSSEEGERDLATSRRVEHCAGVAWARSRRVARVVF